LYDFGRFSVRGVQKYHLKYVYKKSMSKTFPQKIDKNFDVSFSSTFCFVAFSGVSQRREFKNTKKRCTKKSCRKVFTKKKTDKKMQNRFFCSVCLITFLGISRGEGIKKYDKKHRENKSSPAPFLASDPPTHHRGGHRLFVAGPLALAPWWLVVQGASASTSR
jgi:hypothetical protein